MSITINRVIKTYNCPRTQTKPFQSQYDVVSTLKRRRVSTVYEKLIMRLLPDQRYSGILTSLANVTKLLF